MPNLYASATRRFRAPQSSGKMLLAAISQIVGAMRRWIKESTAPLAPVAISPVELLETRQMLSVSMNAAGATVVTPQLGDRVIYVSSSAGSDSNSGLSASSPVKTIEAGEALMRNGHGDELLLKSGDVWHDSLVFWKLSGASAQDPMVISSYGGSTRPTIMSGSSDGITTGASSAPEVDNLYIMNIHFWADGRDPSLTSSPNGAAYATGVNILSKSTNILVENCYVQDYAVNMNFQGYQGPQYNISVRRNVDVDSYCTSGHSQGMYATNVNNLLIEGNLFDHDGYNDSVPGGQATWYNQGIYLSAENTGCVIRDNIIARAAGYGLQARSGGIVTGNVFIDDPVGCSYGLVNGVMTHVGGVTGSVTNNLFLGGANIGNIQGGSGLQIANISKSGVNVANNIFASGVDNAPAAIILTFGQNQTDPQDSVGLNNVMVQNNIVYDWNRGVQVDGDMTPGGTGITAINNVTFTGNDFQNIPQNVINHDDPISSQEHWYSNYFQNVAVPCIAGYPQAPEPNTYLGFANPQRTAATYNAQLGGSNSDTAFLSGVRGQNELSWNANYDAASVISYVSAGFGRSVAAAQSTSAASTGSIAGTYFYDGNANGVWDAGEGISPSWGIYIDANNDGRYDAGDTMQICDSSGRFNFTNLAAGTYYIRSTTAVGWTQTSPANGGPLVITIKSGQVYSGANIGVIHAAVSTTPTDSISGTFFYDTNANGVWNSGEGISPLWGVYIDANNDGRYDAGDTLARASVQGTFYFGGLTQGTYVIRPTTADGWKQTTPTAYAYVLPGHSVTNVNIGEVKLS